MLLISFFFIRSEEIKGVRNRSKFELSKFANWVSLFINIKKVAQVIFV